VEDTVLVAVDIVGVVAVVDTAVADWDQPVILVGCIGHSLFCFLLLKGKK
jgi:hypothetical protein